MRHALRVSIAAVLVLALPPVARADDGLPLPAVRTAAPFDSLTVRVEKPGTRHEVVVTGAGPVRITRVDEDGVRTTRTGTATRDELEAVRKALDTAALAALATPEGSSGGATEGETRVLLEVRSNDGSSTVVSRTLDELRPAWDGRVRVLVAAVQAIETRVERASSESTGRALELRQLDSEGRETWSLRFDATSGELVVTRPLPDGSAKTYRGVATDEEKAAIRLGLERVRFEPRGDASPWRLVVTVATSNRDGSSGSTTWTTRTRTLPQACDRIVARLVREASTRGLARTVAGTTR